MPRNEVSNDIVDQLDKDVESELEKIEHAKTIVKIVAKWIGPGIPYVQQLEEQFGNKVDDEEKPKCMYLS